MLNVTAIRENHARRFGAAPLVYAAPGRVNLIGEHTDYSEGFVMPAAIDFATLAAISPRDDRQIAIFSENFGEESVFDLDYLPHHPRHHWSDYPIGVLTILRQAGAKAAGFNLSLNGDVPLGSGLSSSASVEVATALAILGINATGTAILAPRGGPALPARGKPVCWYPERHHGPVRFLLRCGRPCVAAGLPGPVVPSGADSAEPEPGDLQLHGETFACGRGIQHSPRRDRGGYADHSHASPRSQFSARCNGRRSGPLGRRDARPMC